MSSILLILLNKANELGGFLMNYEHFKSVIELNFGESLEEILYKTCVIEKMNAVQGSKKLGIAKEVFINWRHDYRFEDKQQLFDKSIYSL